MPVPDAFDKLLVYFVFPPFIIAMLIIGALNEMVQRLIDAQGGDKGWRGVYYITKSYHPIFVGALVWLIPGMPLPDNVTPTWVHLAMAGAGVGVGTMICYELTVKTVRKFIVTFGEKMGGFAADWSAKLGGSSNTPTPRRQTLPPPPGRPVVVAPPEEPSGPQEPS